MFDFCRTRTGALFFRCCFVVLLFSLSRCRYRHCRVVATTTNLSCPCAMQFNGFHFVVNEMKMTARTNKSPLLHLFKPAKCERIFYILWDWAERQCTNCWFLSVRCTTKSNQTASFCSQHMKQRKESFPWYADRLESFILLCPGLSRRNLHIYKDAIYLSFIMSAIVVSAPRKISFANFLLLGWTFFSSSCERFSFVLLTIFSLFISTSLVDAYNSFFLFIYFVQRM